MAHIIGLRGEYSTPPKLKDSQVTILPKSRNYQIPKLLITIDSVLAEYGFARELEGRIKEENYNYNLYKGVGGTAMVRFVDNRGEFILYMEDGEVKMRCPILIVLCGIPNKVLESLKPCLENI